MNDRLKRIHGELGDFLRTKRERLTPKELGLPAGKRKRRASGLRREEVAALAGVGMTWYTWLEQGRDINVSRAVLERIAEVLKLNEEESRHLFLLASKHAVQSDLSSPANCPPQIPPVIDRLIGDLSTSAAFVYTLSWNVLIWNRQAQRIFGFEDAPLSRRNLLRMFFDGTRLSDRVLDWERHAPRIVASFRSDYAHAPSDPVMAELVVGLCANSSLFRALWSRHEVFGPCRGRRDFLIEDIGPVYFEHRSLIVDPRRYLRLAIYSAIPGLPSSGLFNQGDGFSE